MSAKFSRLSLFALLLALTLIGLRLYPKPALADLIPHSTAIYAANGSLLRLTLASDSQY